MTRLTVEGGWFVPEPEVEVIAKHWDAAISRRAHQYLGRILLRHGRKGDPGLMGAIAQIDRLLIELTGGPPKAAA